LRFCRLQACAFGSVPVLMTYDAEQLDVTVLHLRKPLHMVLVDLRSIH
jgi:hypothetical protein